MKHQSFEQIEQLVNMIKEYSSKDESFEKNKLFSSIINLSQKIDQNFVKHKHATKIFNLVIDSFTKGHPKKALSLSTKLLNVTKPVSNDFPFVKGDVVYVTRTEHGWYDGHLKAKITNCVNVNGIWQYSAHVFDETKNQFDSDYSIEINHTRDAVKCHF